jgi:hypothetical protein
MLFERSPLQKFEKELKGYIIIGHSGHRNILDDQKIDIQKSLRDKLAEIKVSNSKPCILITGYAEGADELAIAAAKANDIKIALLLAGPEERDKLAALSTTDDVPRYQVEGSEDQLYTNQADLILSNADHILLCWDGIQNNKPGGPSYIYKQVHYANNTFQNTRLYQLVIPREDSPFPVRAIGMTSNTNFISHPELNWYKNFCETPTGITYNMIRQSESVKDFNTVSFWNKYENYILQFILPTALLILTVIVGYIGFENYQICLNKADPKEPLLDFLNYSFKAINLATLNSSVIDEHPECSNFQLNIARISGVAFLIYAFLLAFIKLTGSNLNRFWIRCWQISFLWNKSWDFIFHNKPLRNGPFDTIIGLSEHSHYLALDLLNQRHKVIIITNESSSKYKTSCQQAGAVIYENKPTLRRVLEKAKVHHSDSIYIFSDDDTQNARSLQYVDRYLGKEGKKRKPKLFVHVKEIRERHFLNNTTTNTIAETFQINENICRKLLREFPLDRSGYKYYQNQSTTIKYVKVLILGFSDLAQTLILHLAANGHYGNDLPLKIKVCYEATETTKAETFKAQYPCFFKGVKGYLEDTCAEAIQHEVFIQKGSDLLDFELLPTSESVLLHSGFSLYEHIKEDQIVNLYTCIDNSLKAASMTNDMLPYLNHLKVINNCDLQVFCFSNLPDLQEIGIIEEKLNASANNTPVHCFGNYLNACSFSAIHQNHLDDFSKRLGLWYHYQDQKKYTIDALIDHWSSQDINKLDQDASILWEKDSETNKDANRAAADHIFIKLRSAGVNPNDKLARTAKKLDDIKQDLAEMEHTRWCAQKLIEGFHPLIDQPNGIELETQWVSDQEIKKYYKSLKIHLNLKPFNELFSKEKEKDFDQIEGIPYILNLKP